MEKKIRNVKKDLADHLRDLRLDRNLSQEQAAKMCGLSKSYYCELENGVRNPTLEVLYRIALGYDIEMEELFHNVGKSSILNMKK